MELRGGRRLLASGEAAQKPVEILQQQHALAKQALGKVAVEHEIRALGAPPFGLGRSGGGQQE